MKIEERIKLAIENGFSYDSITGNIYGKSGAILNGKAGGYIYIGIRYKNKTYSFGGHIFAWYYTYKKMPNNQIDHINGIKDDNKIENLRDVTKQQNLFNKHNTKGFYLYGNKYVAQIRVNKKLIHLGCFDSTIEAKQAYLDAKKIYHKI